MQLVVLVTAQCGHGKSLPQVEFSFHLMFS